MVSLWLYLYLHYTKLVDWQIWCETFGILIFSKLYNDYWTISFLHSLLNWSLDRVSFYAFFLPHFYYVGCSTIQLYKLISRSCNPDGIIINIIILFYLVFGLLILRCVRDHVCYNLIIWYKGSIKNGLLKMDTYNIWWN